MGTQEVKPAFYALRPGGWRDYVTLLHLPYTAWHLSYVALGASVSSQFHPDRLAQVLAAFALGLGVAAHALDEYRGRPLRTRIPDGVLLALATLSLLAACALAVRAALTTSPWVLLLAAAGVFLVLAYNLEWWGGRLHTDRWFALAWGSFPAFAGHWSQALRVEPAGLVVVAAAYALSRAQRGTQPAGPYPPPPRGLRLRRSPLPGRRRRTPHRGAAAGTSRGRPATPVLGLAPAGPGLGAGPGTADVSLPT